MSRAEDRRGEEEWRAGASEPTPKTASRLTRYLVGFAVVLALAVAGWLMLR